MNKKTYAVLNLLSVIAFIFCSYYIGTREIDGNNVATISAKYENLFTPATYAFGIWGVIYIALLAMTINQVRMAYKDIDDEESIMNMGPWLILANLASSVWMYFWVTDQIMLSVVIMISCLLFLMMIVVKLNMQIQGGSKNLKLLTWAPISIYSGWITVALVANVAAYLTKEGFAQDHNQEYWAIAMIIIAALIYLYMMRTRHMYLYTLVGSWGIFSISASQWDTNSAVQFTALVVSSIMAIMVFYQLYQKNDFEWESDDD